MSADKQSQLEKKRETARRARRLANSLLDGPERETLLHHAEDLERESAELEKRLQKNSKRES